MLKEKEVIVRRAMILFDAFIVSLAFFFSYFVRSNIHFFYRLDLFPSSRVIYDTMGSLNDYLALFFLIVPVWCLLLYLNGMYKSMRTRTFFSIVWIIVKSAFFVAIIFGTFVFIFKFRFVSRLFYAIFIFSSLVFMLFEKLVIFMILRRVRRRGYNYRRILIVGKGRRANEFISRIKARPEWGIRILGVLDDEPENSLHLVEKADFIGTLQDLPQILHMYAVDEVIFIVPRSRLNAIEEAVYICETEGIKATIAADLFNLRIAKSYLSEIEGIPLISLETIPAKEGGLFLKRLIDIVISGFALVLLSPILIIMSLTIKLTSPGPLLFKQRRIGLNGRGFALYKFRTMYKDAHEKLATVNVVGEIDSDEFRAKKLKCITPIGRFMRKFSIDELPQFYNVLLGHMSLIGPRPSVQEEVSQYKPWQRRRLSMRPGLSCLWQVSGRNRVGFEEWMRLDLEYIDNWTPWLDFKIFIKTIPMVIFGIGAY